MIYLASPYTHEDPEVMQERYEKAALCLTNMMKEGYIVYSPIVHCHEIAVKYDLPKDFDFWMRQDIGVLRHCEKMYVIAIPGYQESKGVNFEKEFCEQAGIPVVHIGERHKWLNDVA